MRIWGDPVAVERFFPPKMARNLGLPGNAGIPKPVGSRMTSSSDHTDRTLSGALAEKSTQSPTNGLAPRLKICDMLCDVWQNVQILQLTALQLHTSNLNLQFVFWMCFVRESVWCVSTIWGVDETATCQRCQSFIVRTPVNS